MGRKILEAVAGEQDDQLLVLHGPSTCLGRFRHALSVTIIALNDNSRGQARRCVGNVLNSYWTALGDWSNRLKGVTSMNRNVLANYLTLSLIAMAAVCSPLRAQDVVRPDD